MIPNTKKLRALHTGTLWFDNKLRGAKENTNWVLEVYGRENMPSLTNLFIDLSEQYEVTIEIRLESENSRLEVY